jgi:predicted homoserine dehydrogenase-like protein
VIIVDRALAECQAQGRPVRFGLIGAGFMGRGVVNQVVNSVPGMDVPVVYARRTEAAVEAYLEAGVDRARIVTAASADEVDEAVTGGRYAVTDDPAAVCAATSIAAVCEVTGAVELGARVTLDAVEHGKHVILLNAEVDGTVGPLLKSYADRRGVIVSGSDGDQPGVQLNLYRFVRSIGLTPLLCGNVKGLQDRFRNPTTQAGFAAQWGQKPHMVTSFADGTKISFEQAIVANATGMTVARRGMYGHEFDGHVDDATALFDLDELVELGGIVDYVVKSRPGPGVFVYGSHPDPKQRHYLNLYKLGPGPLYSFYTPYHLCHFEVPLSVARVVLFADPVIQPLGGPRVEVITRAKKVIEAGEVIDGLGGYATYGECETWPRARADRLLPVGVAEGCVATRRIGVDEPVTYDDVELPPGRLIDRLRQEQDDLFAPSLV